MVPVFERRRIATQATVDAYAGKPFAWGTADCAHLAMFHLRQLGVKVAIAKAGKWDSALGAKRALRRMGVDSLSALASLHILEIPPAAALLGDIVIASGDQGHEALWVVLGNAAAIGWHEDAEGAAVVRMSFVQTRAWRTLA
jgi:hypothetical protein